ncbi:XRE family transcriptional regulator [Streptomyces sp. 8K308]|uniref:helix-turn-helix domain-containing protein n=1 Tax=Streptomyces sp. 8K308 TaxID=2530388 RepID=UPI00104728BF|nr:helix-turn-helix transcriptional regulator [Streptomyces sp. 8K308]TDC21067.1 XRE family transcriptional regulator [Streptomyces sp. 8K308]
MAKEPQLPVVHRYFGQQFQLWRAGAQIRREDIAEAARYSVDTVKSVEQGRRPVPPRLAEVADEMCGARGKLVAGLSYLNQEKKIPERSRNFFQCEGDAIALNSYQPLLIPGLLQTEATVRALLNAQRPPLDDETIEEWVTFRLARQQVLTRRPLVECCFVIYEAGLRCPVGGTQVHKEQLLHLLKLAELRNVTIQVLPFDRGAHPGLDGPMVLVETTNHEHFAQEDGQSHSQFTSDPDEISLLTQRYGMIRMQALSAEESLRFIQRLVDEL